MFQLNNLTEPLLATAIHAGHDMNGFLNDRCALNDAQRLYEEDPYTDGWAALFPNQCIIRKSRFELDLNRPRDKAVYLTPADAWGLTVWEHPPPQNTINRLLARYDDFYDELDTTMALLVRQNPIVVVLDIHSYNHRRKGSPSPQLENPDVNVGTGTMLNPDRWKHIVDCAMNELAKTSLNDQPLDVRENIKFKGGQMANWLHRRYPDQVCVLSLEFKKIFMDETSGNRFDDTYSALTDALQRVRTALTQLLHQPLVA